MRRACRYIVVSRWLPTPERRRILQNEYVRTLGCVNAMPAHRPGTQVLIMRDSNAVSDPLLTAETVNKFPVGGFDVAKMAAAIDPIFIGTARVVPLA